MSAVAVRLARVRERIAAAAARAGRDPAQIVLVAVSKTVDSARIVEAARSGLGDLGESYVQEARQKIPAVEAALAAGPSPRWHFIGRLQRNKAKDVARLFDSVHSVDRSELAQELDRRAGALGRRLDVLLQVSLCGEPQKGGVAEAELPALVDACAGLSSLRLAGLMTVPADGDAELARPVFARLRRLRDALRVHLGPDALPFLSMGMSGDFEVAIEEGATHVRVGTAIFGPREGKA